MLGYVFWHYPAGPVAADAYEKGLIRFHRELAAIGSEGFQRSAAFRAEPLPWLAPGRGYEDWYLLAGSYALDPLNEVVVAPALAASHDVPAHAAGGGAGGLYRLLSGEALLAPLATWIRKPEGMRYPEFYRRAAAFSEGSRRSFWRRQMVFGPASEFLLVSEAPVAVPADFQAVVSRRTRLY